MGRFYHAIYILAIAVGIAWTSQTLFEFGTARANENPQANVVNLGRYDGQAQIPGGQLYVREVKADNGEEGRAETAEEAAFRKGFPELFATEGVVIMFTADWCSYCKPQKRRLAARQGQYNMVIFDASALHREPANEAEKRGKALAERWGIKSLPTTVIAHKGKVVKTFIGLTPWSAIKPHAGKARKNERQETTVQVFPFIRIDIRE